MKKFLAVALALCMALVFVGCNKLPDPKAALQKTLDSITSADEVYMANVREGMKEVEVLQQYPELEDLYLEAQKVFAKHFEYKILDVTVDKSEKTAVAQVEVTNLKAEVFNEELENWQTEYRDALLQTGKDLDDLEIYTALYEKMIEIYSDTSLERTTKTVEVRMTYDTDAKVWVIDNADVLVGEL